MFRVIKTICWHIGLLIGLVYDNKFVYYLRDLHRIYYTALNKRNFKSFGKNSIITPKYRYIIGSKLISIGNNCIFGEGLQLTAWKAHNNNYYNPEISIGNNCAIGDFAHITAINYIKIGNNVLTGKFLLITDNSHGQFSKEDIAVAPAKRDLKSKNGVLIGDNVWIGDKVSILPGVTIGTGSIIGSGAVITKNIPENCIAVGNPAKIIRQL